jgi:hypothetical protein
MATITYLILPSVIKERMSLHDNIDDKLIYPEIKAVQDLYIMPILGSTLFNKILNDIANNTLTGNYKSLVDNYVVECCCNYVMAELPEGLNYQYWNKGVSQKVVDNATQPSMSEMYSIVAKYKSRAEHYAKMLRNYLIEYADEYFPEYLNFVSGVDVVHPERVSYSSPIYLGDETEIPRDEYSLNKRPPAGYNSNDPYYI